jgi:hypothetical protein
MLPPELHKEQVDWGKSLELPNEGPIWPPAASEGYQRRLRLFLFPPRPQRVAIRIDTDSSGETKGYVIRVKDEASGGWRVVQEQTFSVKPADLMALNDLIARSKLWQIYPQHWVNTDPNTICIDGMQVMMERVQDRQYRYSEANAQCDAPDAMLKVAAKMIDLAGLGSSDVAGWLY